MNSASSGESANTRTQQSQTSLSFEDVFHLELDAVEQGRGETNHAVVSQTIPGRRTQGTAARAREVRPWGLALSGGGIRSATFNLGVLQALAKHGLIERLDYISSVSGGGYIASWFHAWLHRTTKRLDDQRQALREVQQALAESAGPTEPREVHWLRRYANYLTPRGGVFRDDLVAGLVWLRNATLNLCLLSAVVVTALSIPWIFLAALKWSPTLRQEPWDVLIRPEAWGAAGCVAVLVGMALAARQTKLLAVQRKAPAASPQAVPSEAPAPGESDAAAHVAGRAVRMAHLALGTTGLGLAVLSLVVAKGVGQAPYVWSWLPGVAVASGLWIGWSLPAAGAKVDSVEGWRRPLQRFVASLFAGGVVGAGTWGLCGAGTECLGAFSDFSLPMIYAFPALCGVMLLGITCYVGVAGRGLPEAVRLWWARASGVAVAASLAWGTLTAASYLGPYAVATAGVYVTSGVWSVSTLGGLFVGWKDKIEVYWKVIGVIAPYVFLAGLLLLGSSGTLWLLRGAPSESLSNVESFGQYAQLAGALKVPTLKLAGVLVVTLALSYLIDVNLFGMHMFYRSRLERAYLGASLTRPPTEPWVDIDPADSPGLAELQWPLRKEGSDDGTQSRGQRPYPLISAAINLTRVRNLAWGERKAASFVFTPDHCGYQVSSKTTGEPEGRYQRTDGYVRQIGGSLSLGAAMTISGAAVNPNSASIGSPGLAALMTLFNLRLGWWIQNTSQSDAWSSPGPRFSLGYLFRELFRGSDEDGPFVHVSDGGHFENLGLYELVKRRCRYIVLSDASEDAKSTFTGLENAMRKCRTDLGAEFEIDTSALKPDPQSGLSKSHCAVGRVRYAVTRADREHDFGYLVYLKPTLTGEEPTDVEAYRARHPQFPHESTMDQWLGESQFESYRALGEHCADTLLKTAVTDERLRQNYREDGASRVVQPALELHSSDEERKRLQQMLDYRDLEYLFVRLAEHWRPAASGRAAHSKHARRLERLLARARNDESLAFLNWQTFPQYAEVLKRPSPDEHLRLVAPTEDEERAGFEFCRSLITFMESVYEDLSLEGQFGHPDQRGWMNLFRHWVSSRMFRATWAIDVANHGARFQKFAERHFQLSPGQVVLGAWQRVEELLMTAAVNTKPFGFPNFLERDDLERLSRSKTHGQHVPVWKQLYAVPILLNIGDLMTEQNVDYKQTIGMAVLAPDQSDADDGGPILHYLRIRDPLRQMGLGRRAVEALWRMDCRARFEPITDAADCVREADVQALRRLERSVKAAVPDAEIHQGEELLRHFDDPHRSGEEDPELLLKQAHVCFAQALRRQPDNEDAVRGLARVLAGMHDLQPQPDPVEVEVAVVPETRDRQVPHSMWRYSIHATRVPQPHSLLDQAIELLQDACQRNPSEHIARYNLAIYLVKRHRAGDLERAVTYACDSIHAYPPFRKRLAGDPDLDAIRDEVFARLAIVSQAPLLEGAGRAHSK